MQLMETTVDVPYWKFLTNMNQVVVGKVRTSHGVKGDLKVLSTSDEYDHFQDFETVVLRKGKRSKEFIVEAVKGNGPATLLKLRGIDTPEEGKLYAGYEILVDKSLAARCNDGEYYQSDLVGCEMIFQNKNVATVLAILNGGAYDLLEVKREDNDNVVLIPFRDEFVGDIDIESKRIQLEVDWILD